jgi:hypothetical protein
MFAKQGFDYDSQNENCLLLFINFEKRKHKADLYLVKDNGIMAMLHIGFKSRCEGF